uniref:Uncharacterized protein n=1 Tax=Panagrolaimus sp. JU765 TaxID=591449 RepID=A0AC34RGM5_9BILA
MSILIGIFVSGKSLEVSIYEQTTGGFWQMDEYDDKLDQIILQWKLFFEEELIKIYVVGNEISNIDFILIDDPLVHLLKMSDIDFTCYLQIKLTPETKIAWFEDNNSITLYEYANTRNGFLEYKLVKCFEARLDLENHVQLMLQFFECDLNQLHFFNLDYSRLEMIKKENNDFSSYTLFRRLSNSQSAIIYGRYLLNDNVQSLIKLPENFLLDDIEQNTLNFKVNKVIPSHWAIQTYQSQTRLMGIDLGASRTVVCVSRNGRAELVKIDREYSMPSVISFVENEPIIGNVAKRHLAKNSGLVLFDLKYLRNAKRRLDGHWVPDEYWWPFGHCIEAKKSSFVFQSKGVFKRYSTVEIYQILLQKLKQEASEYQSDLNEGKDVNQAVITVPDFDNKLMLGNIYAAAELLGLKILDVITETEADLLYFLSKEEFSRGETVAVVDIGGGTGFIEKFSFEEGFHEKRNLSLSGRMINEYLELAVEDLLDIYDKSKVFRQLPAFNFEQKIEIEKMKEEFSFEEK